MTASGRERRTVHLMLPKAVTGEFAVDSFGMFRTMAYSRPLAAAH